MNEREIKVIQIGNNEIEVSLLRNDMFVYVENPSYKKRKVKNLKSLSFIMVS